MITIDIDRFKQFNNLYGHSESDAFLHQIGWVLLDRAVELLACYGGEEMVVLLPDNDLDLAGAATCIPTGTHTAAQFLKVTDR